MEETKLVMVREQSRMTPRFLTESEMGIEVLSSWRWSEGGS